MNQDAATLRRVTLGACRLGDGVLAAYPGEAASADTAAALAPPLPPWGRSACGTSASAP
jgi:hypothetical protein